MNNIPSAYAVDFDPARQDLQSRAVSRMLLEFRRSPVLLQVLAALVSEVQVLSDAVVDVMKYRTLAYAEGVNVDVLGRIVGQPRAGAVMSADRPILTETGQRILCEDGATPILAAYRESSVPGDDDYLQLILLRIISNFNRFSSVPELTAALDQNLGVKTSLLRSGPASLNVTVAPDTPQSVINLIEQRSTSVRADDIYLAPFPTTSLVRVVTQVGILSETGVPLITEDGRPWITEWLPL